MARCAAPRPRFRRSSPSPRSGATPSFPSRRPSGPTRSSRSSPFASRSRRLRSHRSPGGRFARCRGRGGRQASRPAASSRSPTASRRRASSSRRSRARASSPASTSSSRRFSRSPRSGRRSRRPCGSASALALAGLLLLSGAPGGSWLGNALVLGNAVAQSFQIVAMERFAPRYDARALTFLQMAVAGAGIHGHRRRGGPARGASGRPRRGTRSS